MCEIYFWNKMYMTRLTRMHLGGLNRMSEDIILWAACYLILSN